MLRYMRILMAAAMALVCTESFAQTNPAKGTTYPLRVEHRAGNVHNYVFKEETDIVRTHSDNSERTFKREVTYYFTQVAPLPAVDGFSTVHITIDSMVYRFSEDGAKVEYVSMRDQSPNLNFLDLLYATVPLNRTFELVISPYGDIAEVKGVAVDWLRNYVTVEGKDILAPIQTFLWMDGISNNNLRHIADMTRGIIPNASLTRDSVWNKSVALRINNMDFTGQANANISYAQDNTYRIEAAANDLSVKTGETRLYGITEMVNLTSGSGRTAFTIELEGSDVRKVTADCSALMTAQVQQEKFSEKVSTHLSWTLIGQTQW